MNLLDFRSDTVTLPSPTMYQAMAQAALGDDVYGEDPTVNRLEQQAALLVGKAAAMFVPSGTMGNLCAVMAHCGRGDEALVGDESHIYHYEAGGTMVLGSVALHPVATTAAGELPLDELAASMHDPYDAHGALTRLICLENTHNRCGGVILSPAYMAEVRSFAQQHGLSVHLDGARVFNAAVALGVPVTQLTDQVDSVMFCLSKGLAAPVGSLLAGDEAFMQRARRARKMLGGGMRQAGILAAAGLVALEQMVARLAEDHANARMLAEGLAAMPGIELDLGSVQTDIVRFRVTDPRFTPAGFVAAAKQHGLLLGTIGRGYVRAVTHYGLDSDHVEEALERIRLVLA